MLFIYCKYWNVFGILCDFNQEGKMPYLGEVGTEEFLMKLTSQITEMVSAKFTQGKCILQTIVCM